MDSGRPERTKTIYNESFTDFVPAGRQQTVTANPGARAPVLGVCEMWQVKNRENTKKPTRLSDLDVRIHELVHPVPSRPTLVIVVAKRKAGKRSPSHVLYFSPSRFSTFGRAQG